MNESSPRHPGRFSPLHLLSRPFRVLAAAAFALLPLETQATVVIPPSFEGLVEKADTILDGEVLALKAEYNADKSRIYTFVTLKVIETLKGKAETPYTLRLFGGTIDGRTQRISGTPTFTKGDRALFFIRKNGVSSVPLVGIMHGTYWIEKEASSGEEAVLKPDGAPLTSVSEIDAAHEAGAFGDDHGESTKKAVRPAVGPLKLKDFKADIRAQIEAKKP